MGASQKPVGRNPKREAQDFVAETGPHPFATVRSEEG